MQTKIRLQEYEQRFN